MIVIDSHCHLDFEDFNSDREAVLERMAQAGVQQAFCISVKLDDLPAVLALAQAKPQLWATVGVHPDYEQVQEPSVEQLCKLADHPKVIAIGETGLDYFRLKGDLSWQRERFRCHIRAARQAGLPLVVHTRAASADTLALMREEGASECAGVMHCFTEDWETARASLDLGFYISFSGIVTFKSAAALREVAKKIPLDRILVETDAPYLAPVPHRGKRNEPAMVVATARFLADWLQLDFDEFSALTDSNCYRLFKRLQPLHIT